MYSYEKYEKYSCEKYEKYSYEMYSYEKYEKYWPGKGEMIGGKWSGSHTGGKAVQTFSQHKSVPMKWSSMGAAGEFMNT